MSNTQIILSLLTDIPLLTMIFFVLLAEAMFSGSEMALISADKLQLKKKSAAGSKGAQRALELLKHPERVLATVLIGTNICILAQGTFVTIYVHKKYGAEVDLISVIFLTPIILIFGEFLPKTLFQRFSSQLAPAVSYFVSFAQMLFSPLIFLVSHYSRWLSKLINPLDELLTGKQRSSQREILHYLLTMGKGETLLPHFESKLINRILHFSRAQAKNALIPLVDVDAISDKLSIEEALKSFSQTRHSRLPVYKGRIDNIIGVVHIFDAFLSTDTKLPITSIMQEAHYFPESQKVEDILFTMQKQGMQMGIIVDEYGGGVGILTLEDLIEEVVGDISDEYDSEAPLYKELDDGEYLVQARMEIHEMNEKLKIHLPTGHGQYATLAGFLLQQFNRIPEKDDELHYGHVKFVIKSASDRVIKSVLVIKEHKPE